MKKILYGNIQGLRKTQIKHIETLYNFKTPSEFILDLDLARLLVELSFTIRREA